MKQGVRFQIQNSNDQQAADSWREGMKTFSEFPTTEFPDDAGNQISGVTNKLKVVEDYRYWASIALFAFYSLIAILSFIGVCVKSKVCHHFHNILSPFVTNISPL